MSRSRVIVLGLAIGSAVMAAYLAKGFLGKKPDKEVVEINKIATVDVLVASKEIQMGQKLAGGAISWQAWPEKMVSANMITRAVEPDAQEKYETARARIAIFEGEPILAKKLVLPTERGFMSAILPKGYRAISVRISEETGAGGFILPNDRVDVILTRKLDDDSSSQKAVLSETVIRNVRVLAIDQTFRQLEGEGEQVVVAKKTATLELNPEQAEIVSMVESAGQLSLALRSIAENDGKKLGEDRPELTEKFAGGQRNSDFVIVKYGIEKKISNR
jgi:pilus assembly protein CpaB